MASLEQYELTARDGNSRTPSDSVPQRPVLAQQYSVSDGNPHAASFPIPDLLADHQYMHNTPHSLTNDTIPASTRPCEVLSKESRSIEKCLESSECGAIQDADSQIRTPALSSPAQAVDLHEVRANPRLQLSPISTPQSSSVYENGSGPSRPATVPTSPMLVDTLACLPPVTDLSPKVKVHPSLHKQSASLPHALPSQDSVDPVPCLPLKTAYSDQHLSLPTSSSPMQTSKLSSPNHLQPHILATPKDNSPSKSTTTSSSPTPSSFAIPSHSFPFPSPLPDDALPKRPATSAPPLFDLTQSRTISLSSNAGVPFTLVTSSISGIPSNNSSSPSMSMYGNGGGPPIPQRPTKRTKPKPPSINVQKANQPYAAAYLVSRPILRKVESQSLLTRSPASVNGNAYSDLSNQETIPASSSTLGMNKLKNSMASFTFSDPQGPQSKLINRDYTQALGQEHVTKFNITPPSAKSHTKSHSITSFIPAEKPALSVVGFTAETPARALATTPETSSSLLPSIFHAISTPTEREVHPTVTSSPAIEGTYAWNDKPRKEFLNNSMQMQSPSANAHSSPPAFEAFSTSPHALSSLGSSSPVKTPANSHTFKFPRSLSGKTSQELVLPDNSDTHEISNKISPDLHASFSAVSTSSSLSDNDLLGKFYFPLAKLFFSPTPLHRVLRFGFWNFGFMYYYLYFKLSACGSLSFFFHKLFIPCSFLPLNC